MYRIADEPRPTGLARFSTNPLFPLLSTMLAGQWAGVPWFALNGAAMGSPTRRLEASWLAAGLLGSLVGAWAVLRLDTGAHSDLVVRFALLGLTTWKLGCAYAVHALQLRTHEIFLTLEAPGLNAQKAVMVLLAASFLLRPLVLGAIDSLWLRLVLMGAL